MAIGKKPELCRIFKYRFCNHRLLEAHHKRVNLFLASTLYRQRADLRVGSSAEYKTHMGNMQDLFAYAKLEPGPTLMSG